MPPCQGGLLDLLHSAPETAVLRCGYSYRQGLEALLAAQGIMQVSCLEFGSLETIYTAVAAGLACSLLLRVSVEPLARQGRVVLHALPEAAGWVETLSIRHREQGLSSAHRNFLVLLQASEGPHWAA